MQGHILRDELEIEPISERHKNQLEVFETDNVELKQFLVEDALNNQEIGISHTYLWFYKENNLTSFEAFQDKFENNDLVAYITILADAIRVHGTHLGQSFLDKGVNYKTLPALKVGRLCVHKNYARRGIGTLTTEFVMRKLIAINEDVGIGCRFVIVDAKKDAIHFYRKLGFEILKKREKGTIPMYYDMIDLLRYRRESKKEIKC